MNAAKPNAKGFLLLAPPTHIERTSCAVTRSIAQEPHNRFGNFACPATTAWPFFALSHKVELSIGRMAQIDHLIEAATEKNLPSESWAIHGSTNRKTPGKRHSKPATRHSKPATLGKVITLKCRKVA